MIDVETELEQVRPCLWLQSLSSLLWSAVALVLVLAVATVSRNAHRHCGADSEVFLDGAPALDQSRMLMTHPRSQRDLVDLCLAA